MMKKALVIDDSPSTRKLVAQIMQKEGFEVTSAANGQEGMNHLSGFYNIIVSDLNMPGADGIELTQFIRKHPRHKKVPVLIISTDFRKEKIDACKKAGATDFMVKPFTPEELASKIKQLA